jgi:ATP-binding protein involved in chromosome partitioning
MSQAPRKAPQINHQPLLGVNKVIVIASGKGGVGKSTTTVMLAHALAAQGQPVAILDADIYGPSIPKMLQVSGQPEIQEGLMIPHKNYGIACNSMGFLVPEESANVWRGPMVTKALNQLARGTLWNPSQGEGSKSLISGEGQADVSFISDLSNSPSPVSASASPTSPSGRGDITLLVDFPPGTGDVQLSMAQQVPIDGAILVTTPQDVALADARKCGDMFRKLNIPIKGVIENMSWFEDASGQKHKLFGEGGGEALAKETGAPLLAQIPQRPDLLEAMDKGIQPKDELLALYLNHLLISSL